MESSGHLDRESKTNTTLGIPRSGLDPVSASCQLYDFRPPPCLSEPPFLSREVGYLAGAVVRDLLRP